MNHPEKADAAESKLFLDGLEIDDVSVSDFLSSEVAEGSDTVSKVMAASCTTCECCCSY